MITEGMSAEGWVEHDGKSAPERGRGAIRVMLRDGRVTWSRFGFWTWDGCAPWNIDIVAWIPGGQMKEAA